MLQISYIINGAKLGGATGAMAPLVFWSRNQSLVVSKWHQLFLPSFGANVHYENSKLLFFILHFVLRYFSPLNIDINQNIGHSLEKQ